MPTITVYMESVSPDPLNVVTEANSAPTTITWQAGLGVKDFMITNLDSSVFGVTGSGGYVTTFSVTDDNSTGLYNYSVEARAAATGASPGACDPRIKNEATHPPPDKLRK